MKIQRRRLIKAAVAAPFVMGIAKSRAFPLHGGVSSVDKTASALASIANSTWSSDQIATGNHVNNLNYGCTLNGSPLAIGNVFAYSGGCYLPGQKRFMLPGTGGHSDSPNTGIATLDLPSLTWSVTELACNYHNDGVADPSNPTGTGDPVYKNWPNANGQRAPSSGHRYANPTWMPEIGFGFSFGYHSYNQGNGTGGYYLFNSSGQHDQAHGYSTAFINDGSSSVPTTVWVPSRKVLWGYNTNDSTTSELNPIGGAVSHKCNISDAAIPNIQSQGPCVLIPDPKNPGDQAIVFWTYNYYAGGEKVAYIPKVGSGAGGQTSSAIAFGGPVPPALSVSNAAFVYHNSCWFDFAGNYKSGSTKILVWDWNGGSTAAASLTGLYLLDISTWTWAGPLTGSAGPFASRWAAIYNSGINPGASYGFRNVFVITDYIVEGSYIPIGVVQPDNTGLTTAGQLYFYKIPWSAL